MVPLTDNPAGLIHGRIRTLDSLRAVVALTVVVHHVWTIFFAQIHTWLGPSALAIWDAVQAQNHRAVMAFFVLSGYTIALTTAAHPPVLSMNTWAYLQRRLRRIVPLFYGSLAWTAGLGLIYGSAGPEFSWQTLVGNVLFLQTSAASKGAWFLPFGANGPYWSLSYEMWYYLAFPLALIAVGGRNGITFQVRLRFVVLGLFFLIGGLGLIWIDPNPFAYFALAWIVWIAGYNSYELPKTSRSLVILVFPVLSTTALSLILALAGRTSDTLTGTIEGTALALLFGVLATWRSWIKFGVVRTLDKVVNVVFARLGRGSYALYLLHYPLLLTLRQILDVTRAGIGAWVSAGMLFVLFVVWFCPWIERTSGLLFRPTPLDTRNAI